MRIHDWLEASFDSKSKIRIIRLFFQYPEREFTEREIANFIQMSPNTVNLTLKEICKSNLLFFRSIGRANIYKLNQESILFKYVGKIFEDERKIEKELFDTICKHLQGCASCIVFGSFVRKSEDFDSDLDLLVVTTDKKSIKNSIDKLEIELSSLFGTVLSPIILTPYELRRKWNKKFLKEILNEGILICGKSLGEVYGKGD